jgi:hypothetical protein
MGTAAGRRAAANARLDRCDVRMRLGDRQGQTIQEATPQLGWSQGMLAGRLARGRNLLAQRRANRGVVRSAGSLAAVVSQHATSAAVPTARMSSPVKAAALIAAGPATVAGVVLAQVALRTEGALKAGRSSAGWGVCQLPKPSRSLLQTRFWGLSVRPLMPSLAWASDLAAAAVAGRLCVRITRNGCTAIRWRWRQLPTLWRHLLSAHTRRARRRRQVGRCARDRSHAASARGHHCSYAEEWWGGRSG